MGYKNAEYGIERVSSFAKLRKSEYSAFRRALQSKKLLAYSICRKIRRSISPTQFNPNLCAQIHQMLFIDCPACAFKKAASEC